MEVLLLQDVPGIGKKNDLLVVGDGFALNYLLPKRAALVATPLVRKRYAEFIRGRAEEREKERTVAAGVVKALSGKTITLQRKISKTGKLYAAVAEKNIIEALKDQHSIDVTEDAIQIQEHIKSAGSHQVLVKLGDQAFPLNVIVEPEKAA